MTTHPYAAFKAAGLAEHPADNLRVTEHSGKRCWVHAPKIQGDSLVGRRGYDVLVENSQPVY